jgi:hypothetical protein
MVHDEGCQGLAEGFPLFAAQGDDVFARGFQSGPALFHGGNTEDNIPPAYLEDSEGISAKESGKVVLVGVVVGFCKMEEGRLGHKDIIEEVAVEKQYPVPSTKYPVPS